MTKAKVWKIGSGSLVVTIPQVERASLDIEVGDIVKFEITDVIKKKEKIEDKKRFE